jgi:hypothetical protein
LREHARPHHLINQTGGAGKKETEKSDDEQPILFGTFDAIGHKVSQPESENNPRTDSKPFAKCKGALQDQDFVGHRDHELLARNRLAQGAVGGVFVDFGKNSI